MYFIRKNLTILAKLINKIYIRRSYSEIRMQQFHFQPQINPASSKALTKLKNDKLIPSPFQISNQQTSNIPPIITYPHSVHIQGAPIGQGVFSSASGSSATQMTQIKFNPNSSFERNSRSLSPVAAPTFNFNIQRQNSASSIGLSTQNFSGGVNNNFGSNQAGKVIGSFGGSGILTNQGTSQQIRQSAVDSNKPLSALQPTTNLSTNMDISRMRSSSASQFSFLNIQDSEKRISHLQNKLTDYNEQILQANIKLNEKQKKITELEQQLAQIRKENNEIKIKAQQKSQGDDRKSKKISDQQEQIKNLRVKSLEVQGFSKQRQEKIKNLQGSLDKILLSKNLEIQSLNQSCKQLSKHVEILHYKHQQQIRKLLQTIQALESSIKKSDIFIQNQNLRLKSHEEHKQTNELSIQVYARKHNENLELIKNLENQNNALKTQLSSLMEGCERAQMEVNRSKEDVVRAQNQIQKYQRQFEVIKGQLQRERAEFANTRKIGEQQIQFLNVKIEQLSLQKQRLKQEIQLTKVVSVKRNMVFQRRVIYELKQQNDRLWAKLIQKSDNKATIYENSPEYWTINQNYSSNSDNIQQTVIKQHQKLQKSNSISHLQQQYRAFVEQLENQERKAQQNISDLNKKQKENNIEDMHFYRNKCINLENMIEEHLQINLQLKRQLDKARGSGQESGVASAQVIILKGELEKQRILHQTLQRSFNIFKEQYQQRFKKAQYRVTQIQDQHKKVTQQNVNMKLINEQQKIIQRMEQQIQNYAIQNSNLNIRVSENSRWENMYKEIKGKYDAMSPIGVIKNWQQEQTSDKKEQLNKALTLIKLKDQQIQNIKRVYGLQCQSYEQQIATKHNQLGLLQRDLSKIERQFGSGKLRYDQLVIDIGRLQQELQRYKNGSNSSSTNQNFNYYLNLITSKLKEILNFIKQVKSINKDQKLDKYQNNRDAIQKELLKLYDGAESRAQDCINIAAKIQSQSKAV